MKKFLLFLLCCVASYAAFAQTTTTTDSAKSADKILIIPYDSKMYFSDADADLARASKMQEPRMRNEMRSLLEMNIYHQLLAKFDAISLLRATSLDGEKDLLRIYGATQYITYTAKMQDEYNSTDKQSSALKKFTNKFAKKAKDQLFWTSDSAVMLGVIKDKDLFKQLSQKYNEKYILFVTQFEVNTSNKNTIEWLKQDYKREYTIHYNLFDKTGKLIRAEILTIRAGNENDVKEISTKYFQQLAQKLKEIVDTVN